jgi:CheY-like chemotaxis protein
MRLLTYSGYSTAVAVARAPGNRMAQASRRDRAWPRAPRRCSCQLRCETRNSRKNLRRRRLRQSSDRNRRMAQTLCKCHWGPPQRTEQHQRRHSDHRVAGPVGSCGVRTMDQPPHRPLKDRHILVVEDDPVIAMDLQGVLETAGATVVGPAHNASEALTLVERWRISAAVLDYRLRAGDTLALARMLAERGIPFLFQTSDPASVLHEHPDATILPKPFRPGQLTSAVEALLAAP